MMATRLNVEPEMILTENPSNTYPKSVRYVAGKASDVQISVLEVFFGGYRTRCCAWGFG
ncbi:hypothetical protein Hanom_Chr09g00849421 [Helianthus anomalus]